MPLPVADPGKSSYCNPKNEADIDYTFISFPGTRFGFFVVCTIDLRHKFLVGISARSDNRPKQFNLS